MTRQIVPLLSHLRRGGSGPVVSLFLLAVFFLGISPQKAGAVAGSSFFACVANTEITNAPATAATLAAAVPVESAIEAAGASALAADLSSAVAATVVCGGATPCGTAASLTASAAAFPGLYASAEASLAPIAQGAGGVSTAAFGGMGIVEPFSGPGYWIPVVGGVVLNLEPYAVALQSEVCAANSNIVSALASLAASLSADLHNTTRVRNGALVHMMLLKERLRAERDFQAEPSICSRSTEVANNGPTLLSAVQTSSTINASLSAIDTGLSSSTIQKSMASWPVPDAGTLFGGNTSLSSSQVSDAIRTIWLLTHPDTHTTTSGSLSPPSAPLDRQVLSARVSLVRHVLTSLLSQRIPSTGGESLMSRLDRQVHERWGTSQWLIDLHTLHPTTLQREIAMERSLRSEIRYLRLVSKQHREALLAMIASQTTK